MNSWYHISRLNRNIICLSTLSLISISLVVIFLSSILVTLDNKFLRKFDFVFKKGTFITSRVYGFLKMALYKMDSFFFEVVYSIDKNSIEDIIFISDSDLKRFYKKIIWQIMTK